MGPFHSQDTSSFWFWWMWKIKMKNKEKKMQKWEKQSWKLLIKVWTLSFSVSRLPLRAAAWKQQVFRQKDHWWLNIHEISISEANLNYNLTYIQFMLPHSADLSFFLAVRLILFPGFIYSGLMKKKQSKRISCTSVTLLQLYQQSSQIRYEILTFRGV